MNATAKKLRRIVKAAKANDGSFKTMDTTSDYGMLHRMVRYGLIEHTRPGEYKLLVPVAKFVDTYAEKAREHLLTGRAKAGQTRHKRAMSVNKPMNLTSGPIVRIMPYDEQHSLIMIGKRVFLGHEVALTSKSGKVTG